MAKVRSARAEGKGARGPLETRALAVTPGLQVRGGKKGCRVSRGGRGLLVCKVATVSLERAALQAQWAPRVLKAWSARKA